jgi:hypothetical protein
MTGAGFEDVQVPGRRRSGYTRQLSFCTDGRSEEARVLAAPDSRPGVSPSQPLPAALARRQIGLLQFYKIAELRNYLLAEQFGM